MNLNYYLPLNIDKIFAQIKKSEFYNFNVNIGLLKNLNSNIPDADKNKLFNNLPKYISDIILNNKPSIFEICIGDFNLTGHNKYSIFTISTNYPLVDIRKAYDFTSQAMDINIEDTEVSEQERSVVFKDDNEISSELQSNFASNGIDLSKLNLDELNLQGDINIGKTYNVYDCRDVIKIIMAMVRVEIKDLEYNILDRLEYFNKNNIGYGLYNN